VIFIPNKPSKEESKSANKINFVEYQQKTKDIISKKFTIKHSTD